MRSLLALVVLSLALAGCASTGNNATPSTPSTSTPVSSTPAASADVHIKGFAFSPASYPEEVGGTVSWVNDDSVAHTVTADDGSFDSGPLAPGQTFTHTFATAGTVAYHCKIHGGMNATIVVGGGSPTPASTTPTPSSASPGSVAIVDFSFAPSPLSVPAGTTVTWTNDGERSHTVTADDGSFSSGTLAPGQTFSHTFTTPGTYSYHCSIHGSMTAKVVVT